MIRAHWWKKRHIISTSGVFLLACVHSFVHETSMPQMMILRRPTPVSSWNKTTNNFPFRVSKFPKSIWGCLYLYYTPLQSPRYFTLLVKNSRACEDAAVIRVWRISQVPCRIKRWMAGFLSLGLGSSQGLYPHFSISDSSHPNCKTDKSVHISRVKISFPICAVMSTDANDCGGMWMWRGLYCICFLAGRIKTCNKYWHG